MAQTSTRTTYAAAGVNLAAADDAEGRIGPIVRRTYGPRVLAAHGGFAGLFRLDYDERLFARNYRDPVLVSCTDGVGSKVLLAATAGRFDTIGFDLVAMSVNDMLCCGAEPLFFLDYLAVHKLTPPMVEALVDSVARACEEAGCALLGGETAEMPDLYKRGHFDLAGFAVGVVERGRMIESRNVRPGDDLIGLPSTGLHSNGYALARKLLLEDAALPLFEKQRSLNEPLIDALLRPTRIYVKPVLHALRRYAGKPRITGMAHITGSGLPGNVPRLLPPDCDAVLRRGSWPVPPIFGLLERHGIEEQELYDVFNMGIGFVLATRAASTAAVIRALKSAGQPAMVIGRVRKGSGQVEIR
ncbi:MAG: phosphoribosylformylglycinamidine cyclo-ligase [Planctomycetes bacterium]|nr:phosphoribosylformylglycinamidine cyclo-ligase [Planctomycetota bacterium]